MSTVTARVSDFEEQPIDTLSRGRALWRVIKRKPLGGDDVLNFRARDKSQVMPPVDQRQQLHPRGAAMVEQRIQRGADGAPRVQDVVHQDDVLPGDRKRNIGGIHHGLVRDRGKIVAIKSDIQNPHREFAPLEALDLAPQPLRQRNTAAADTDENQLVQIPSPLQDLVRQSDQRAVDFRCAHQLGFFTHGG